jgi:hypothetical protein
LRRRGGLRGCLCGSGGTRRWARSGFFALDGLAVSFDEAHGLSELIALATQFRCVDSRAIESAVPGVATARQDGSYFILNFGEPAFA